MKAQIFYSHCNSSGAITIHVIFAALTIFKLLHKQQLIKCLHFRMYKYILFLHKNHRQKCSLSISSNRKHYHWDYYFRVIDILAFI